jgi:hypothetical protein
VKNPYPLYEKLSAKGRLAGLGKLNWKTTRHLCGVTSLTKTWQLYE